jgi:predicted transcriptional regulator
MPSDDAINLSLLLPPHWWHRLQRIAETCYASPREFVREAVEAEIVRRELLLERRGEFETQWLELISAQNSSRLQ